MWKVLGKEGLAVKALWPVTTEEDKILTRQAKFLRDSLKSFRAQAGKAKKGWTKASIVVSDAYPQWKVDVLRWMQTQYQEATGFPESFMKDLKDWAADSVEDKKLVKLTMQFASFAKKEVEDVGPVAMDTELPFDQKTILDEVVEYVMKQINVPELDVIKLGSSDASDMPDRVAENATPGNPYLWIR